MTQVPDSVAARWDPARPAARRGALLVIGLGPVWVWLVLNERPGAAALAGGGLILLPLLVNTLIDLTRQTSCEQSPR